MWEFTLEPIAFMLAPGERLRLEIASSAFPLYDRNPSTEYAAAACRQLELGAIDAADSAFGRRIPPLSIFPSKESRDGEREANSRFLRLRSTASASDSAMAPSRSRTSRSPSIAASSSPFSGPRAAENRRCSSSLRV